MSDFHFANPTMLSLAWIALVLVLVASWALARRARRLKRFADSGLLPRIAPGSSRVRPMIKFTIALGAMVALLLGSMDPRWGVRFEEIQRRGMDVFFVAANLSFVSCLALSHFSLFIFYTQLFSCKIPSNVF